MDSPNRPPKLMDRVKATMRLKRYSPRTEKTYCYWIRYFIRFHGVRHPANMGATEVQAFLEHLAVERYVAATTQNQALNALVFLYRHVLEQPLGDIGEFSHAKRPRRLPIVLSHDEVMRVLNRLSDPMHLMATLMYGSGLRVLETCRLRVRDIDFDRKIITVVVRWVDVWRGIQPRYRPYLCMLRWSVAIHAVVPAYPLYESS